jgi:hypothetical protein
LSSQTYPNLDNSEKIKKDVKEVLNQNFYGRIGSIDWQYFPVFDVRLGIDQISIDRNLFAQGIGTITKKYVNIKEVVKSEMKSVSYGNTKMIAMFDLGLYDKGTKYSKKTMDSFDFLSQVGGILNSFILIGYLVHWLVASQLFTINVSQIYNETKGGDTEDYSCWFRFVMIFEKCGCRSCCFTGSEEK